MKLRTLESLREHGAFATTDEDNETFQNPTMALSPLLPSAETFRRAGAPLHGEQSVVRSHRRNRRVTVDMTAFTSRCFPRTIKIPARLRNRPLEALPGGRANQHATSPRVA